MASLLLLAFIAACGDGGGAETASPSSVPSSVATSPPVSGACLATTTELHVVAQNTDYDTDCLAVGPDTPFTIEFENRDEGIGHNIVIREGTEQNLFEGEIVTGPATTTYQADPIAAGEYRFFCIVHPLQMAGAFLVGFE